MIHDTRSGTLIDLTEGAIAEPAAAPSAPLRHSHFILLRELMALLPYIPEFPVNTSPADFEAANEYQRAVAAALDRWHLRLYEEANANASYKIERREFSDQFSAAIDGNATYELDKVAEQMREDDADNRRASRYSNSFLNAMRGIGR